MVDGLDGLRHDAVVGRHHQHDDVGGSAPRARIAVKASWPGVSMKVIRRPSLIDLVRADVLRDAAGLAGDDVGAADAVEQQVLPWST